MPPRENPEKRKPAKTQPADSPSVGLERRLHAADAQKNASGSKSLPLADLQTIISNATHKFTLASLEVAEFAYIEKKKGKHDALSLALTIEKEIAAQLRHNDAIVDFGDGKFIVYLPDTAKVESTMVLERLSKHISKRNSKRPIETQISLRYELIAPEALRKAGKSAIERVSERRFEEWLKRYDLSTQFTVSPEKQAIQAKDLWFGNQTVSLTRFGAENAFTSETFKNLTRFFLTVQHNGLPLFPTLFDFQILDDSLILVTEPTSELSKDYLSSVKHAHTLCISICDLFLLLDGQTPRVVLPIISLKDLRISNSRKELVLNGLEDHLFKSVFSGITQEASHGNAKAIDQFASCITKPFEAARNDECYDEIISQLEQAKSKLSNSIQKIRAILKRHEERLRRKQASTKENTEIAVNTSEDF